MAQKYSPRRHAKLSQKYSPRRHEEHEERKINFCLDNYSEDA